MNYHVITGDSAHELAQFPDNHFHSIVCDPPYGIDFLGKAWDHNTGDRAVYEQCLRVLRPGGHILAFSAARTYHHLAMTLEQVGFEIRDQIMWIYGSGFPKSQDVGKNNNMPEWSGWGTNLKPAHEPICMARKPMKKSIAKNVQEWGTGAINVDATRIPYADPAEAQAYVDWMKKYPNSTGSKSVFNNAHALAKGVEYVRDADAEINPDRNVENRLLGRFPANIIHDGSPEVTELFPDSAGSGGSLPNTKTTGYGEFGGGSSVYTPGERTPHDAGTGCAARFFYCAKVNKRERNAGVENTHPTVKPVDLMRYLIKLVTPPGGRVLDPFTGSGSTGMAAVELGHEFVGIEREPAYAQIAQQRIEAWHRQCHPLPAELFEEVA